jgi:hypothetical protein
VDFTIIGPILEIRIIAAGRGVRHRKHLAKLHGPGRWRKMKGIATVCLPDGTIRQVELHWYEASGIGRRQFKIKYYLS